MDSFEWMEVSVCTRGECVHLNGMRVLRSEERASAPSPLIGFTLSSLHHSYLLTLT